MKVNPRSKRSSWQEAINADRTRDDIGCLRQREVSSCAMGVQRELGHCPCPAAQEARSCSQSAIPMRGRPRRTLESIRPEWTSRRPYTALIRDHRQELLVGRRLFILVSEYCDIENITNGVLPGFQLVSYIVTRGPVFLWRILRGVLGCHASAELANPPRLCQ